jgi:hypothetical protein
VTVETLTENVGMECVLGVVVGDVEGSLDNKAWAGMFAGWVLVVRRMQLRESNTSRENERDAGVDMAGNPVE